MENCCRNWKQERERETRWIAVDNSVAVFSNVIFQVCSGTIYASSHCMISCYFAFDIESCRSVLLCNHSNFGNFQECLSWMFVSSGKSLIQPSIVLYVFQHCRVRARQWNECNLHQTLSRYNRNTLLKSSSMVEPGIINNKQLCSETKMECIEYLWHFIVLNGLIVRVRGSSLASRAHCSSPINKRIQKNTLLTMM